MKEEREFGLSEFFSDGFNEEYRRSLIRYENHKKALAMKKRKDSRSTASLEPFLPANEA